jgi:Flp pilus assembly protein TadG
MSSVPETAPADLIAQKPAAAGAIQNLAKDEDGATAAEFALIAFPFVTLLLGILSVCLYFFTVLEMENAVWQGSRDLRTGAYQTGIGRYNGLSGDALKNELRKNICGFTRDPGGCENKLRVMVQARNGFGSLTEPNCRQGDGSMKTEAQSRAEIDAGGASSVVLITGCYAWEFGGKLPFFQIGNMPDGSHLIQGSYAFRSEPFGG